MAVVQHPIKFPRWRRILLLCFVLLGFVALIARSVYLQGVHRSFYQKQGDARYSRSLVLFAHRGMITDRNGEPLAISTPVESIWANPADTTISTDNMVKLAKYLELKPEEIKEKLSKQDRDFVYLKRRISPELANHIMALHIPGIYMEHEYRRFYPAADVAAHVVGFTGIDERGQEGVELKYQGWLSGKPGSRHVIKDRAGHIVEDMEEVKLPQDGRDLVLSLDRKIQYLAYRELSKAVDDNKAKAGAAIVLDAKTGEVLAMVNIPTYNPNNPNNISGKSRNRALVDVFEPGSTMKPMTISAALETGKYTPDTKIDTSPGFYKIGTATIHDSHPAGVLSVAQVIQKSSNVGASKIALTLDPHYMWSVFGQLGFGTITHIGFPGEVTGKLRGYKQWRPIEQATMSYGNGISVTLMQLARAYTVFANDGELKPVTLLKMKPKDVAVGQQVFSANTAKEVRSMLELVVLPGGTAPRAQIMGYRVAGKTGTAHKPGIGGYQDKYIASFVGMAPASNPRLIVAVMIDEPSAGKYYGGEVAAPVFSAVMGSTLRMMGIPQDAPNDNVIVPPADMNDVKEST
jgi:cell division protein FtsI (penicillin-binding protein 3)